MVVRVQGYFPVLPFCLETSLKFIVVYFWYYLIFFDQDYLIWLTVDSDGSSVQWVLLFLDNSSGSPSSEDASSGCCCLSIVTFISLRSGICRVFFQGAVSRLCFLSTNKCKDSKRQGRCSNFHFWHNQIWTSTSGFAFILFEASCIWKISSTQRFWCYCIT